MIEQFPIVENIEELEEEDEKILAIGVALKQFTEDGEEIIYDAINEPEEFEEQENLIQIDIDSETQYIFKPCVDKSEYNRSIKLLDTSGMVSLEEATRRSINTVFAQVASEIGG